MNEDKCSAGHERCENDYIFRGDPVCSSHYRHNHQACTRGTPIDQECEDDPFDGVDLEGIAHEVILRVPQEPEPLSDEGATP